MQYGTTSFDQVRCSGLNIQGCGNKLLSLSGANNQERASFAQDGTLSAPIGIFPATNSGAAYSVTIPGYVPGRVYYVQIGSAITATSTLSVNGGAACELDDMTGTAISKTAANAVLPVFQPDAVSHFLCLVKGGGTVSKTWSISNIAVNKPIFADSNGFAYVSYQQTSSSPVCIYKIDQQGNIVWSFADTHNPNSISVDPSGNVYVSYYNTSGISLRKLNSSGIQIWELSDMNYATCMTTDHNGYVYVGYGSLSGGANVVRKLDGLGNQIWSKSVLIPTGICVDNSGNVFVCCYGYSGNPISLCKLNSSGTVMWSKSDSQIALCVCVGPRGLCVGYSDGIRFYNTSGTLLWSLTDIGHAYSVVMDNSGYIYIAYGNNSGICSRKVDYLGNPIWGLSDFYLSFGVSIDNLGYVYFTYMETPIFVNYIPPIRKMQVGPP